MSQDLMNRLQKLKKQEAEAKQNLDRLTGRRDQLVSTLKKDFGCVSIKEAEAKLTSLEKDVTRRKERAEKLLTDIEEAVSA